jgi:hypothetical protein
MTTVANTTDEIKDSIKSKIDKIQAFIMTLESEGAELPDKKSSDVTNEQLAEAMRTIDALYRNTDVKQALALAVASANKFVHTKKVEEGAGAGAGGTQRVGTKKRKRRKRRGKGTGKNKPLSEVNVVL